MAYYNSPFHLIDSLFTAPLGSQVYIVSDSEYKAYKQKQAVEEIRVLEDRAASYERTALHLRDQVKELQTKHELLPAAEDK